MARIASHDRFWMICRKPAHDASRTEPKARFSSRAAALAEAEKLATQTGAAFVILEATEVIRTTDRTDSKGFL